MASSVAAMEPVKLTWKTFSQLAVPALREPKTVPVDEVAAKFRESYQPSVWTNLFSYIGGGEELPEAPFYSLEWLKVATLSSAAPAILVIIGLIVALALYYHLSKREVPTTKSSPYPLTGVTLVTYVLLVVGACCALSTGRATYEATHEQLQELAFDLADVEESLFTINASVARVHKALGDMPQCCPAIEYQSICQSSVQGGVSGVDHGLLALSDQLVLAHKTVSTFGSFVMLFKEDEFASGTALLLFTPTLVCILVLTMLVSVALASPCLDKTGGRAEVSYDTLILKYGSIPLSLLVFMLVVTAAVALGTGVTTSSFCTDADNSVLKIVLALGNGKDSETYRTAQYYIQGVGLNPAATTIHEAWAMLYTIDDFVQDYFFRAMLELLGDACNPVRTANFPAFSEMAHSEIDKALRLSTREHFYGYYEQGVHRGVCGGIISSIGWLTVTYSFAGFVCLPILSLLAHDYLVGSSNCYTVTKQAEVELAPQTHP